MTPSRRDLLLGRLLRLPAVPEPDEVVRCDGEATARPCSAEDVLVQESPPPWTQEAR